MTDLFPIASLVGKERKTLRSANDMVEKALVDPAQLDDLAQMAKRYAVAMTPEMYQLATEKDDAIARQFVPDLQELTVLPQEMQDPIGDYNHAPTHEGQELKALVHRHADRVLLKPTNVCAVYCRFCFRREMVGPEGHSITQNDVDLALDYIEQHPEITEVILTGGDPFMLSLRRMEPMMMRLNAIAHLRRIRFHTRMPIVSPGKLSKEMIEILTRSHQHGKKIILAIHVNHAREFSAEACEALTRLATNGIMLLGQSVLLRGVNDNVTALADLCTTMLDNHIKPYYLHHPDLTVGTAHFRMSFEKGMALMSALRQQVSGIAVPQYTLDIPGGFSKIAIHDGNIRAIEGKAGHYKVRDESGQWHDYVDILP